MAWKFTEKLGWEEIDEFDIENYDELIAYGVVDDCKVAIVAHRAKFGAKPPYDFFVSVELGGFCWPVATPSLPDLLAFLKQYKDLAT